MNVAVMYLSQMIPDPDTRGVFMSWLKDVSNGIVHKPLIINSCGKYHEGAIGLGMYISHALGPLAFRTPMIHSSGSPYSPTGKWAGLGAKCHTAVIYEWNVGPNIYKHFGDRNIVVINVKDKIPKRLQRLNAIVINATGDPDFGFSFRACQPQELLQMT